MRSLLSEQSRCDVKKYVQIDALANRGITGWLCERVSTFSVELLINEHCTLTADTTRALLLRQTSHLGRNIGYGETTRWKKLILFFRFRLLWISLYYKKYIKHNLKTSLVLASVQRESITILHCCMQGDSVVCRYAVCCYAVCSEGYRALVWKEELDRSCCGTSVTRYVFTWRHKWA